MSLEISNQIASARPSARWTVWPNRNAKKGAYFFLGSLQGFGVGGGGVAGFGVDGGGVGDLSGIGIS